MAEKPIPKTQRGLSSELVIDRALPGVQKPPSKEISRGSTRTRKEDRRDNRRRDFKNRRNDRYSEDNDFNQDTKEAPKVESGPKQMTLADLEGDEGFNNSSDSDNQPRQITKQSWKEQP